MQWTLADVQQSAAKKKSTARMQLSNSTCIEYAAVCSKEEEHNTHAATKQIIQIHTWQKCKCSKNAWLSWKKIWEFSHRITSRKHFIDNQW